jgi:hypothetical protein
MTHNVQAAIAAIQQDVTTRWFAIGMSPLLCLVGFWGLVFPHQYRKAVLGVSARLPDQRSIAPFLRFVNSGRFILVLRVFSLFPIGMAIALFLIVA